MTARARLVTALGDAATLRNGAIAEANYRMLDDAEVARLIGVTTLEEDAALTGAYPRKQGARVEVTLRDGRRMMRELADVVPATETQIRERFRAAAAKVLGEGRAVAIEATVDTLERIEYLGALQTLL